MDIVVGGVGRAALPDNPSKKGRAASAEGYVLAVRSPRRGGASPDPRVAPVQERRRRKPGPQADPPGSRVITLLIPEPSGLPEDLATGNYRVQLRFVRQG